MEALLISREWLKAGGEGDDKGWDGWMASLTQQTWIWVISRSRWWTGNPGVLQSKESQRDGQDWATEQQHHSEMGQRANGEGRLVGCEYPDIPDRISLF